MRHHILATALLALAGHAAAADVAVVRLSAADVAVNETSSGTTATVSITDNAGQPATLAYDLVVTVTGGASPVTMTIRAGANSASATVPVQQASVGTTVSLSGSFSGEDGTGSLAASFTITAPVTGNG